MKQYKINRTQKSNLPPEEMIKKHQNFGNMMARYDDITKRSKVPLYKNKKLFLFLIILGLLAYILATELNENKNDVEQQNTEIKK